MPLVGGLAHSLDLSLGHFAFETAKPTQAKAVLLRNACDFVHLGASDLLAHRVVLKPAFKCKGERFCHAGVSLSR